MHHWRRVSTRSSSNQWKKRRVPTMSNKSGDVLTECLEAVSKTMLSVGSGDGSQQESIVRSGLRNLQVTFYDTKAQVLRKYPPAKKTLAYLEKECQVPPRFQIDASKLNQIYSASSFDLIFFSFPRRIPCGEMRVYGLVDR